MASVKEIDAQIAKLQAERSKLMEKDQGEAKSMLESALATVNSFGEYGYDMFELVVRKTGLRGKASKGSPKRAGADPSKVCPICKFQTNPPHDARKHRSQVEKKPFTAQELTVLGLTKA
ncbi:hypothetical protein NKH85_15720 [Mesorhizobium sp. M0924]|uniref:hypothetical protein n=1 Tax=unclassified Mesorhizobium TaxID=325217 RepID=UPI00333A3BC3